MVEAEAEVEVEVEAAEPNEDDEGNESEAENQLIIAAMRKPDGIDYKTLWEGHDLNACMKWPVLVRLPVLVHVLNVVCDSVGRRLRTHPSAKSLWTILWSFAGN